jgi:hypothetical protein
MGEKMKKFAFTFVLGLFFTGFSFSASPSPVSLNGTWVLTSINDGPTTIISETMGEKFKVNISETIAITGGTAVSADMTYTIDGNDQKATDGGTITKAGGSDYLLTWASGPDVGTSTKISLA